MAVKSKSRTSRPTVTHRKIDPISLVENISVPVSNPTRIENKQAKITTMNEIISQIHNNWLASSDFLSLWLLNLREQSQTIKKQTI